MYTCKHILLWACNMILGACRAHRGLPVGFLLLRYSVLFAVESLSLLYLGLCVLGDDALIS